MKITALNQKKLSIGIVGAGPSGALLGYFLSSQGHNVKILERKKETERKICGEYLCPKGVELLEELNLFDRVCKGFDPLYGMVLVSPHDEVIPTYFPRPKNEERGLAVNRQIFDQNILQLAIDHGVTLLSDTTVNNVLKNENGKWIAVTDSEQYEFDLLVAADGRQSKIGHTLGHIKEINTKRVALHCYLPRKIDRGQRLGEMHIFENGSYCGLDPISDDEVNFSIVCDSIKLKNEKPNDIINDSIKNSKRLSAMFDLITDQTKVRIVTCLKNNNSFIAGDDLAYVGDAAGFIDPLTGEGMYNALLSSTLLARSIAESETVNKALHLYKVRKIKIGLHKSILNHFFQILIRSPFLINLTVRFLKKSQDRANQFIGIIGNIHGPVTGLIKMLKA